jgi:hypothetical protein
MTANRRTFLMTVAAGGAAALTSHQALAQAKLDDKDPAAMALGYVSDTAKADEKKYPKHAATQFCAGCALYQPGSTDAAGNCPLFAAKLVNSHGWCSAWAKKA